MTPATLRETVLTLIASGKNYAYVGALMHQTLLERESLSKCLEEIARLEARAIVDMAVNIETRLDDVLAMRGYR